VKLPITNGTVSVMIGRRVMTPAESNVSIMTAA
jgi:hypothetical protein